MTDINLNELRGIAEAATPGEWEAGDIWVFTDPVYPDDNRLSDVLGMKYADEDRARIERERGLRNATHIATFDPPTVLALLSRLEAAEKVIADALSWMNTGDGRLTDHPLRRILSTYTKGTDRD